MQNELTFTVKFTNLPPRIISTVLSETEFKTEISLDWKKHIEFAESTLAELTACVKTYDLFEGLKARFIEEYEAEQSKIKNGEYDLFDKSKIISEYKNEKGPY
jgi:hypothetical protein